MIIQNINPGQGTLSDTRLVSNDVPAVVAAASIKTKRVVQTAGVIPQRPASEQLKNVVNVINMALQQSNQNLAFSLDPNTDKLIVRMVDTETGQLIRQFPSEAVLAIARSIDQFQQFQQGLLIKQKA